MPGTLRAPAPRPKPWVWRNAALQNFGRDEAPLSVGASTADSIKVFRAPGANVAQRCSHCKGDAHQARSSKTLA